MDGDKNMNTESASGTGQMVATIIILAVVVIGGLYFLMKRQGGGEAMENQTASTTEVSTQAIETQSSADNTASIQSDLNSTDVTTVDSSLK